MTFIAWGKIEGQDVKVVWKDGSLSGSPFAVQLIQLEAANLEGELVGPVGQQTETKHLGSALSAMLIIDRVLTAVVYTGEIPEPGNTPPRAII
jgi:hypothetical protein